MAKRRFFKLFYLAITLIEISIICTRAFVDNESMFFLVASLTNLLPCGQCKGLIDYRRLTQHSNSSDFLCGRCQQMPSLADINESSETSVSTNALKTKYSIHQHVSIRPTTTECTPQNANESYYGPERSCENREASTGTTIAQLLQVRIFVLEKFGHKIVRSKVTCEVPSHFKLGYILEVVEDKIQDLDGVQTYYTTEPTRKKSVLIPIKITLSDGRAFDSIRNGHDVVNFVIAAKGVRVLKDEVGRHASHS